MDCVQWHTDPQTFKQIVSAAVIAILAVAYVALAQSSGAEDKSSEWKPVQEAMGRPGKLQPDGTFKFCIPIAFLLWS